MNEKRGGIVGKRKEGMQSYLQVVVLRPAANFAAGNSSKARRLPCGAVGAQYSWLMLMEEGLDLLLWLFFFAI